MGPTRRRLLGLYLEIRVIPVLLWSGTAITLGTALAADGGTIPTVPGYLVAIAVGVLLQGLVAHTVNEVSDWRSGTDRDPAPRTMSGGSKVIVAGLLTERELAWIGGAAAAAAVALGAVAAAAWGVELVLFGLAGLAGATLYTLPPVRASYRPLAGEAIAFGCVWACVAGAHLLQSGRISAAAAAAGIAHGAFCVGMLMTHHYLDRGPDRRAAPPKMTSVVRLGRGAKAYAVAWSALAAVAAIVLALAAEPAFAPIAVAYGAATVIQLRIDPESVASVTRGELAIVMLGIAGGLGGAALMAPALWLAVGAAAALIAIELRAAGALARAWAGARAAGGAAT